jgi:ATP-dependent DNA helicase RecG
MTLPTLRAAGQQMAYLPSTAAEPLAECLVAFANSDGGSVILGLDEKGRMLNGVHPEELESALKAAERLCRPPIVTGWEQIETPTGNAYAIKVPRSPELHSLADGRVLIRVGAENRPLGGDQIRQLAATKSSADFEAEPMPGARRDDLDEEMITEYIEKRQQRQRRVIEETPDELLQEIGSLSRDGVPTTSGLLLFGRNPNQFIPHAGLVYVKFPGTQPGGEGGLAGYGRREEFNGPLARVIEGAWQVIWGEMAVGAVVTGLERQEIAEYPAFAVREALVNAVCHRDYRLKGRRIEVRMYSDRLEVISPGGLPGFITVDNIVDEHFSRNPRLVNGLFQWGYIEELGLGIDRMIEDMVNGGHPPPKFEPKPYSFTVTLYNARERKPIPKWENVMNERQARALNFIRENGRITSRDYQLLCPDVSPETLRLDLQDLVNRGLLLRIGAKKGTYYVLK